MYDRFARQTANNRLGERVARTTPPALTAAFLRGLFNASSVDIVAGYLPVPRSGRISADTHHLEVELVDRQGSTMAVRSDYVVDGTQEGYGLHAFGLPVRLGREGRVASTDPSRHRELWAGRRLFATRQLVTNRTVVIGEYPILRSISDADPEKEDTSMGASPIIPLRLYEPNPHVPRNPSAPWLLSRPPANYNASDYAHFENDSAVLETIPLGLNVMRYSGKERVKSLPGWWRQVAAPSTHYLRNNTHPWLAKTEVRDTRPRRDNGYHDITTLTIAITFPIHHRLNDLLFPNPTATLTMHYTFTHRALQPHTPCTTPSHTMHCTLTHHVHRLSSARSSMSLARCGTSKTPRIYPGGGGGCPYIWGAKVVGHVPGGGGVCCPNIGYGNVLCGVWRCDVV